MLLIRQPDYNRPMRQVTTIAALRDALDARTPSAFVPTMGNLHEGHVALVREARATGLPVVASIFVNRLQFAPHEDFDRYPRTLREDCERLAAAGCDVAFTPDESVLYPQPQRYTVQPDPALADILEGHFRPGFFTGVSTVVMKLFCIVQPAIAVFGKKDYQQVRIIERMIEQFALPIRLIAAETRRADDGLALSSRNGYLSAEERRQATALGQALDRLASDYQQDPAGRAGHEARATQALSALGWQPDYLTVRRRDNLLEPDPSTDRSLVVLGAARLGKTRLIDNREFTT